MTPPRLLASRELWVVIDERGYPVAAFVEKRFADDCLDANVRSQGFEGWYVDGPFVLGERAATP